jgi:decaprenyl-phosphate phosphoribosyltransferase
VAEVSAAARLGERPAVPTVFARIRPYILIARPDHWPKNALIALGVLLAAFYRPDLLTPEAIAPTLWAVAATCLVASSNYVLNEILDAPTDRNHPTKRRRPIPTGHVRIHLAYAEWLVLATLGLLLAAAVNRPFFYSSLFLLAMGVLYNVPPVRLKDLPHVDVLAESINSPIRLTLGWFAVHTAEFPPISLLLAFWMFGAFLMASKRLAEYRSIGSPVVAGLYRSAFRGYDEEKILISMFFSSTTFALFLGVFIIRYHLELILTVPLVAGFVCYYLHITLKPDSAAQSPERLHREWGLIAYLAICALAFVGLMFLQIPILYDWFNVSPSPVYPLWKL